MATWGVHLRIAEKIIKDVNDIDEKHFVIGSVGPDCGAPNEDWSIFDPPTNITHWTEGTKRDIRCEEFYDTHIKDKTMSKEEKSYLLGYYVHLLTDIKWSQLMLYYLENNQAYETYKTDKSFIWTIKEDWYDLDHKYLRDEPDNIFKRVFVGIDSFNEVLHYYPKSATINQVKYIRDFYLNPPSNLDREYIYMTEHAMTKFVEDSTFDILNTLKSKDVL